MKNEGIIERSIQAVISAGLLLSGIFLVSGLLSVIFMLLAGVIAIFAVIEFCPLYKLLGINRYKKSKK